MDRVTKTSYIENIENLKEFNSHFLEKDRKEGTLQLKIHKPKPLKWILDLLKVLNKNKKKEGNNEEKIEKEKKQEEEVKNLLSTYTNNEKNKK